MLCIEDVLSSLQWVKKIGGLDQTIEISKNNLKAVETKLENSSWLDFLSSKKETRSCTSICLKVKPLVIEAIGDENLKKNLSKLLDYLEKNNIAYDIGVLQRCPIGIRIWEGLLLIIRT